jgi:hypothetical protein
MWRCVDLALTDFSEERIASIFRVEKSTGDVAILRIGFDRDRLRRNI